MTTDCGTQAAAVEPLVVRPKDAWRILQCGNTRGYELVKSGELESFLDGRSRKITVKSIHGYITRKLAAGTSTKPAPQPRRRGRPPKASANEERR